jgi:hypothetical protein
VSLLVIVGVLGITTVLSLLITAPDKDRPEAEEGAGIEAFAGEVNDPPDEASEENKSEEAEPKEEAGG